MNEEQVDLAARVTAALNASSQAIYPAVEQLMAEAWAEGWLYDADSAASSRNPYISP